MAPVDERRGPRHSSGHGPKRRRGSTRRNRLVLSGSVVVSIVIVAAWFPAADLVHERAQLDTASAALHRIDGENAALHARAVQLETPASAGRIAREQYGLVAPGDVAYQVLPASSAEGGQGRGGGGATPPAGLEAPASSASATSGGFTSRVVHTLEFWR